MQRINRPIYVITRSFKSRPLVKGRCGPYARVVTDRRGYESSFGLDFIFVHRSVWKPNPITRTQPKDLPISLAITFCPNQIPFSPGVQREGRTANVAVRGPFFWNPGDQGP